MSGNRRLRVLARPDLCHVRCRDVLRLSRTGRVGARSRWVRSQIRSVRPMKTASANSANSSPRLGTCPTTTAETGSARRHCGRSTTMVRHRRRRGRARLQHEEGVVADAEEAQTTPMSASYIGCLLVAIAVSVIVLTVTDSANRRPRPAHGPSCLTP